MKRLVMLFISLSLLGCAAMFTESELDQFGFLFSLAKSGVMLSSLNTAKNIEGLDELSRTTGIDVTTPVLAWFDATKTMLTAFRAMNAKLKGTRAMSFQQQHDLNAILEEMPCNESVAE